MEPYTKTTKERLLALRRELKAQYHELQGKNLKLDMSEGKSHVEQLDLSMGLIDILSSNDDLTCKDGTDYRSYGVPTDIDEVKELIADMMETDPSAIILYDNSSLNVMYDTISQATTHDIIGGTPWCKLDKVKFLYPALGCDRHFAITECLGIEMINAPMTPQDPNVDIMEELVSPDDTTRGIWCMPKCSNSRGCSYSGEIMRRFVELGPIAPDFEISWDNAYSVHHLYDHDRDHLVEILAECKRSGSPNVVCKFTSISKISFFGLGIAALATSYSSLKDIEARLKSQTIGHDKVNQLRHIRSFGDIHGMMEHMRKYAGTVCPKFEAVGEILERELGELRIGQWSQPKGDYFISSDSMDGCTREIVARYRKTGVVMTPVGATYPCGKNPHDSNIRITPTYPPLGDLIIASELSALYVKPTNVERLLKSMD